jgi:hypothetical protein
MSAPVKGFGCRPSWLFERAPRGRRPKAPQEGTRGPPPVDGCRLWRFDGEAVLAGDALARASGGRLPMMMGIVSSRVMVIVRIAPNRCSCNVDRRRRGNDRAALGAKSSSRCMMGSGSGRDHSAAVLTPASGGGGARGSPPRPKLSTMIMRPPQQGHGGR